MENVSSSSTSSIYKEYFEYMKEYQKKYGKKTVVLLQVGAFFEIYGFSNCQSSPENVIEEVSEICQLNISEKKYTYEDKQILMGGFRDFTLEKYVTKLTESGYTVPVFIQEKTGKDVIRKLDHVYSIGTFLSCDVDSSPRMTNNIMCVWFELHKSSLQTGKKDTLVYGVSIVNIFTGKSSVFQYETAFYLTATTFDELERHVSIFAPSEVLIISPFEKATTDKIIQYTGIHSTIIHTVDPEENLAAKNCTSQRYMKQILTTYFGQDVFEICGEFHNQIVATQSYCYLLNFLKEHNPGLVYKIAFPEFTNTSDRMILANHTLLQLNIIDDSSIDGKKMGVFSSVMNLLNKCCSPMGKRLLQFQLTNPTFHETWLRTEYQITDAILKKDQDMMDFRKQLGMIRDMEKMARQFIIRKIYPSSIYHLYESIQVIKHLNNVISQQIPEFHAYLCESSNQDMSKTRIENTCNEIANFLNRRFIIDACKGIQSMSTFDVNIIQTGVSQPLDELLLKYTANIATLHKVHGWLNKQMNENDNSPQTTTEYVKIHETEKSGFSLQITTKRSQLLKTILEKRMQQTRTAFFVVDDSTTPPATTTPITPLRIQYDTIKFSKSSSTMMEIECPFLNDLCKSILFSKEKINTMITKIYQDILAQFENSNINLLEILATYVAKMDVVLCKAYVAKKYNYCSPIIETDSSSSSHEKSFVVAKDLRHALIEHIQEAETYVANDIEIGRTDTDGILLYGTNAVGKTSLIRSVGVAIVMAQAGFYVPCSQFSYRPYTAIFSRILGNDNLFKGLSTFAVEMSELRIILKMADENSLILGDELCSGTEMESALSIFVSGLLKLHEKKASFLFATHFHEITKYEEIQQMKRLALKHMEVTYNRELDCLVYDRKLKAGSGPTTYGLEVCKSLYLDEDFLETAYAIRNKYYPESKGVLAHTVSKYNAKKVKGMCEMCGMQMGEEIHHLLPQKDANEDGFIGGVHKNHVANLMSVCEDCHDAFHKADKSNGSVEKSSTGAAEPPPSQPRMRKTKTTKGIKLL
jgi:DNA mismatch repair protein MutS